MFIPRGVADLANKPIGTGPYALEAWTRGDSILLGGTARLLGREAGDEDRDAALLHGRHRHQQRAALRRRRRHQQHAGPRTRCASSPTTTGFQVLEGTSNGEIMLAHEQQGRPDNDKRIRQAVMYAIDRKAVLNTAWNGLGELIGGPVPPTDP